MLCLAVGWAPAAVAVAARVPSAIATAQNKALARPLSVSLT
jgi:hypothetical protein